MRTALLDWALYYASRGWHVFPCWHVVNGQCACSKGADCPNPGKHPRTEHGFKDATSDEARIRAWWALCPHANIGIATGAVSKLFVIDVDPRHSGDLTLETLVADLGALPDSLAATTQSKGRHLLFLDPGGIQSRAGVLGPGLDVRGDGGYIVAAPSVGLLGEYSWDTLSGDPDDALADLPAAWLAALRGPEEPNPHAAVASVDGAIPEGERNNTLTSLAGSMRRRGMEADEIEAALQVANSRRCTPPLPTSEVTKLARSVSRYEPEVTVRESQDAPVSSTPEWPAPPDPGVYHGVVGQFVREVEPHTEADPIALTVQFLTGFGSMLGRGPYFLVEADEHHTNVFSVIVGISSRGRKGTSWGRVRVVLDYVDMTWTAERVQPGLSSGEGLIWAVRDPIMKREKVRGKKGEPTTYEEVLADPGIVDKRLLILETEFASVLRMLQREGNALSAILRNAWDGRETLQTLTKNTQAKATKAHISLIGHVTKDEVRRYLDRTEQGNGFANRICWMCAKRSKLLPEGGSLDPAKLMPIMETVAKCIASAKGVGRVMFDPAARELWIASYGALSDTKPGMLGSITSRAEAQCLRWALLYALLDGSAVVRVPHLWAAFGLWAYSEDSARFVFGDALGDPLADELLRALRASSTGMTRTAMRDLFSNNRNAGDIGRALAMLAERGLAHSVPTVRTGDRGRPAESWIAVVGASGRPDAQGVRSFRSFMSSLPAPEVEGSA